MLSQSPPLLSTLYIGRMVMFGGVCVTSLGVAKSILGEKLRIGFFGGDVRAEGLMAKVLVAAALAIGLGVWIWIELSIASS